MNSEGNKGRLEINLKEGQFYEALNGDKVWQSDYSNIWNSEIMEKNGSHLIAKAA